MKRTMLASAQGRGMDRLGRCGVIIVGIPAAAVLLLYPIFGKAGPLWYTAAFLASVSVALVAQLVVFVVKRRSENRELPEDWKIALWPLRIAFLALVAILGFVVLVLLFYAIMGWPSG